MDEVEGQGHQIVASAIVARARVPGADDTVLDAARAAADAGCPFYSSLLHRADVDAVGPGKESEMATDRTASVTWRSLIEGSGTIDAVGSAAFGPLDVTWASRAEDPQGRTSPEELIAAAWASCFSMALSHGLAGADTPPAELRTTGHGHLPAGRGDHPRPHRRARHGAEASTRPGSPRRPRAKVNCPVSKALTGIPEVTLDAALA